jgi:predicted RNA-binding protein with TRAM domain
LVRNRKKRSSEVYRTDLNRLSVYPQYKKPESRGKAPIIKEGDVITLRITGLDDDGRPTGIAKGYTIVIVDGEVTPGEKVKVVVERVLGKTARARLIED